MASIMLSVTLGFIFKKIPFLLWIFFIFFISLAVVLVLFKPILKPVDISKQDSVESQVDTIPTIIPRDTIENSRLGRQVLLGDVIGKKRHKYLYYTGINLKDSVFMLSYEAGMVQRTYTIPIQIGRVYIIDDIMFRVLYISRESIRVEDILRSGNKK
jgi:hypothetical protein